MHGHDGLGARRDRRFDPGGIQIIGSRIRFHRHRRGPGIRHGQPGGDEGVRGHDHFVARPDATGANHEVQRVQTVGDPDAVLRSAVGGELAFKGLQFLAQQIPAGIHAPDDRPHQIPPSVQGRSV